MEVKTINKQKIMNVFSCRYLTRCFYVGALTLSSLGPLIGAKNALAAEEIVAKSEAKVYKVKIENQYQVQFKARKKHDFLLSADYLFFREKAPEKYMPGVIVLHDCHSQRKAYKPLSMMIAAQGLHTLSLDLRGYGKSVGDGYSELEVKKHAKDIIGYQNEMAALMSYWSEDLLTAYEFLREKVGKSKGISIVASGCAGPYAVMLAEKIHIKSLVLITPNMSYADKERYKNLVDIPSYFISSAQHTMSYATAQELFTWSGAEQSKLQVYKGDKLNYKIMKLNKYLTNDIALWLKFTLR
jgi:dienelactone hydrolase